MLLSKSYRKIKSYLKIVRGRISIIKSKRKAYEKYMRDDVIHLFKSGLKHKAYLRGVELISEMTRTQCYDTVDKYCDIMERNLSAMHKHKGSCIEECREAASGIMFAAAMLDNLWELRELTSIFLKRYGNSLNNYVNKQFAEMLKSGHPTSNELLQNTAAECSSVEALQNKQFHDSAYNKNLAFQTLLQNLAKESNDCEHSSEDGEADKKSNELKEGTRPHIHVHAKLPDYDDLVAQMAALRGNGRRDVKPLIENPKKHTRPAFVHAKLPDYDDLVAQMAALRGNGRRDVKPLIENPKKHTRPAFVHAKLPDYDDLVAQMAALRGNGRRDVKPLIENPKKHTRPAFVHAKLPDYDDMVAQMAALRGNGRRDVKPLIENPKKHTRPAFVHPKLPDYNDLVSEMAALRAR